MTRDKLLANLEKLRQMLPSKPSTYTPQYPKNVRDSLFMYLRASTLDNIRMAAWRYESSNWPLPLYMNPQDIRLGRINKHVRLSFTWEPFYYYTLVGMFKRTSKPKRPRPTLLSQLIFSLVKKDWVDYYEYLNVSILTEYLNISSVDEITIELFQENFKHIKACLYANPILKDRSQILDDIYNCYRNKNWAACICTMYPLLDAIVREFCSSVDFTKDVSFISANFKGAGFKPWDIDNLKHGALASKMTILAITKKISWEESNKVFKEKCQEKQLGLPGIALSSFLTFASKYYGYVRKETKTGHELNRHAIIHAASKDYGTHLNVIKLFTFFFLTLELEPVLKILFAEE
ncbi:MAG TPA: hypothetical protein VGM30_19530 [Puia sp.]|jgi:hypothetical protein